MAEKPKQWKPGDDPTDVLDESKLDPIDRDRLKRMGPRDRLRQVQEMAGVPREERAVMGGVSADPEDPLRVAEPGPTEAPAATIGADPAGEHELVFGESSDARTARIAKEDKAKQ